MSYWGLRVWIVWKIEVRIRNRGELFGAARLKKFSISCTPRLEKIILEFKIGVMGRWLTR